MPILCVSFFAFSFTFKCLSLLDVGDDDWFRAHSASQLSSLRKLFA